MKKVFIGLLTFSLGAYIALSFVNVFAFTNPSANPPAGNIAPVFSSLTINDNDAAVTGLVLDNDNSTVNGRFRANFDPATATTTIGGSTFNVDSVVTTFTNNVGFNSGLATNTITPREGINAAPIRIRGATSVENTLDVWNDISNSSANSGGAVNVNDTLNASNLYSRGNLAVDGVTTLNGNVVLGQPMIGTGAKPVDVNDDLNVSGKLYNAAGDLTIDDTVLMKKNVDLWGTLSSSDGSLDIGSSLWATGTIVSDTGLVAPSLNVFGFITNTNITDKLTLEDSGINVNVLEGNVMTINGTGDATSASFPSGILTIRNGARGVVFDQNEIMSTGGTLYINYEGGQDVTIGSPAVPSNLIVNGTIGRFYSIESSTAVPVNVTDSAVAVCDAGDFRIACSGSTSNTAGISFHGAWTSGERTCNARLKNGNSAAATIYARAYCFSSNG